MTSSVPNLLDVCPGFAAPNSKVDEDPVTGSAHCKLVPYRADRLGRNQLIARQLSRRDGTVHCELSGDRVILTGHAVDYLTGTIQIG